MVSCPSARCWESAGPHRLSVPIAYHVGWLPRDNRQWWLHKSVCGLHFQLFPRTSWFWGVASTICGITRFATCSYTGWPLQEQSDELHLSEKRNPYSALSHDSELAWAVLDTSWKRHILLILSLPTKQNHYCVRGGGFVLCPIAFASQIIRFHEGAS